MCAVICWPLDATDDCLDDESSPIWSTRRCRDHGAEQMAYDSREIGLYERGYDQPVSAMVSSKSVTSQAAIEEGGVSATPQAAGGEAERI